LRDAILAYRAISPDRAQRGGNSSVASSARAPAPPLVFAVAVIGIAVFCGMDAVVKGLTLALGAYTTILWRSLAGVVVSGAVYAASRPARPSQAVIRLHLIRGAVSAVSAVTYFWGMARMPMAQAVALAFIAPLTSLFLAALLLGERITRSTITGSLVAMAGVIVILIGQWQSDLGPAALLGAGSVLLSAIGYAYNIVLMRQQAQVAGPIEVAFAQSVTVSIFMLIGAPFFAALPDAHHIPMIFLAALLAVVSLSILAWAYARGEASYLVSSEYTGFIWAGIFGWLFFAEHVALPTLLGAGLIVAGCVIAARQRPVDTAGIEVGQ
jgi:S-adenosylmethionine uptake transporter